MYIFIVEVHKNKYFVHFFFVDSKNILTFAQFLKVCAESYIINIIWTTKRVSLL